MAGQSIVILGGGVGGLVAAHQLRRQLGREHRVILIDKQPKHIFAPSLLWLMVGQRKPAQIMRDLHRLGRKGVEFVPAEVRAIEPAKRLVRTSAQDFLFDYLIVALGAELAPEAIPGFSAAAHNLYDLGGVLKLREALKEFEGGTVAVVISSLPFKCPAAPYEAAMLMEHFFRTRGIRGQVDLHLFTPETLPMPVAGPALGQAVRQMVEAKGIAFHPNHKLAAIDPAQKRLTFDNGAEARYDLLIGVPPHRSPGVVREAGLADGVGWIPVDKATLKTADDNTYALGDIAAIKLPSGVMLPKAGVFAHAQAEVVAHNIAAEINGGATSKRFNGHGYCFLEMGHGVAGYASGNFYAAPAPQVRMRPPGRVWHWGKVLFEKWWLWRWF